MILFLRATLILLIISTLAGVISPYYWFFDLFNNFRLQILLTAIVFVCLSVKFHKHYLRYGIVLCFINIILFAIPLYFYPSILPLSNLQKQENIKIISANVLYSNTEYQQAIDSITDENPDIIAVTEPTQEWINQFDAIKNTYKYAMTRYKGNNLGIAIYSKLPFKGKFIDIGTFDNTLAYLEFEKFNLFVVHPIPPFSYSKAKDNQDYIDYLGQYVQKMDKPTIVTGDFNNTLWSEATKKLYQAGLNRINPYGVAYTWPVGLPVLAVQIDHFFAKGIKNADFKVLSSIGSDHYPIQAIINVQSE